MCLLTTKTKLGAIQIQLRKLYHIVWQEIVFQKWSYLVATYAYDKIDELVRIFIDMHD